MHKGSLEKFVDNIYIFNRTRNVIKMNISTFAKIFHEQIDEMSLCVRKPTICLCENKDADQLRGDREADQRLCFRYTDSTISLLLKSEISSF